MITSLRGIPVSDTPFIKHEVQSLIDSDEPLFSKYNEIITIRRKELISWLKQLGNKKMLKGIRSARNDYFLLMLDNSRNTLKVVPLPWEKPEENGDWAA
jgi:hypothetical protein